MEAEMATIMHNANIYSLGNEYCITVALAKELEPALRLDDGFTPWLDVGSCFWCVDCALLVDDDVLATVDPPADLFHRGDMSRLVAFGSIW